MNSERAARVAELSLVDHLADVTLPAVRFARYTAYRNALIADGQDAERVVELLSLFLWQLTEGCSANGVH